MSRSTRARQGELERQLWERRGVYEVQITHELLALLLEDIKHTLVTCAPAEFLQKQGEAKALQRVIKILTRAPLTDQQAPE